MAVHPKEYTEALSGMLQDHRLTSKEKSAVRFALWCIQEIAWEGRLMGYRNEGERISYPTLVDDRESREDVEWDDDEVSDGE